MRSLLAAATILVLFPSVHSAADDQEPAPKAPVPLQPAVDAALRKVVPSVVGIWYGEKRHVTGVVVGKDGLVVTCGHIPCKVDEVVEVRLKGKKPAAGKILAKHKEYDLALVQILGGGEWPAVEVGSSATLTHRDPLLALGFPNTGLYVIPGAEPPCYARLGYRRDRWPWESQDVLPTTVLSYAGDSGSPLFDLTGSLVGVLSSGAGGRRTCFVHADTLVRAWKDLAGDRPAPIRPSAARPTVESAEVATARGLRAVQRSVVEVWCDERWVGIGVYVGGGFIVTKASALLDRDVWVCLGTDDVLAWAPVVATDPTRDLALLKLKRGSIPGLGDPVNWADVKNLPAGIVLAAVTPPAFTPPKGVVCFPARDIPPMAGTLPVQVKDAEGGVEVTSTFADPETNSLWMRPPPFPFRVEDVITHVAGVPVPDRNEFVRLVFNGASVGRHLRAAGELVAVTYRRQGKTETVNVHLRNAYSVPTQLIYPCSYRYSGFPTAIASDLNARPEHCGAPVVDAEGRVVGLLIARAMFIESVILPAAEVRGAVEAMRKSVAKK